jgi:hypothetical protein
MRLERPMKRTLISSLALGPALLLAALLLPATAAAAGPIVSTACTDSDGGTNAGDSTVTCNVWAKTGTLALPGAASATIWGFAGAAADPAGLPGPVLVADAGDHVTVNLTNTLGRATSIVFGGQAMVPDTTGAAASGGTKAYIFDATTPGTYLYEAGLIPGSEYQAAMGLYGLLVVRPAGAPGQAYADAATAFADEAGVVLGEVDPALNNSATPWTFDLRNYAPKYSLVNGQAYTSAAPSIATAAGNKLLLRYANAGLLHHSMGALGLHQAVLGADGSELPYPRTMVAETIAPGQSADVLVSIPLTTAASTKYALYDASFTLNNSTATGIGGMLAIIDAAGGTSTGDTVGPVTSGLTLTPTATGIYTLTASVSDATTGASNVVAAEYKIDGVTTPMTASDLAFDSVTEAVTSAAGAIDTTSWAAGTHVVYVRGQDAAGNWGAFATTSITIGDRTGPATSAVVVNPARTTGSVNVAISATGDDSATGGSNVTAAEWFIDTVGADGSGITAGHSLTPNKAAAVVSLTGSIPAADVLALSNGSHTVYVHSQDAGGYWGTTASATLTVDKTGPTTSGLAANPRANNGSYGQSSSNPTVRVTASFTDADSLIATGEGFIDTVGASGTGFPFAAVDGVFNAATEAGYADIPLTTINLLATGPHTIYVHGKDSAGNWGTATSIGYLIDRTAPTLAGITPTATNPTLGGGITVTLNSPADPAAVGGASGVAGGEYWMDTATPAAGGGTPFTGTGPLAFPDSALTTGNHTFGVRIRDYAGNWSTASTGSVAYTAVPIFSNGFDTGAAPWGWSSRSTNSTTRLNVTTGTVLAGTRSLQAQGNNTNYVQQNFGTTANPAWPTYDARFYFRPNGNTSTGSDILSAATSNTFGTVDFRVRYRLNAGTPQVQIQVGTANTNTTWTNLTGGTTNNVIEVVWQAVGSAGPNPGTLTLTVNGTLAQTLTTTSTASVGAVRLGSVTSGGSSTLMYFDAFASKRSVSPLYGP